MNIAKIVTVCAAWGVLALVSCGKLVATDGNIDVIPLPEKVVAGEGAFVLKPTTSVVLYFAPENIDKAVDLWRDVMEETLLKLYLEPKPFESREHRQHWVFRVASNECRKLLRTPWKRRTGPLEDADEAAVFDQPAQSELFQEVMSLPPNYRAAVYLHYYEGYSVKEIAVLMHALPSTVQTWLFRARGQLKLKLKEADSP